jgi:sialidase-1
MEKEVVLRSGIQLYLISLAIGAFLCQGCDGQPYTVDGLWTTPDRIPVLCVAPNGGLLAFAAQRATASDYGYCNATLRRSMDNGTNWTPLQVVGGDGTNTYGVGVAVVDHTAGTVFLFVGRTLAADTYPEIQAGTSVDTERVYLYLSVNSGTNWVGPTDLSSSVKHAGWDLCNPGPAAGIQLASGRLVVPCYFSILTNVYPSVMYSDDHGATWASSSGATNNIPGYDECSVVALTNGNLMMIARNDTGIGTTMGISISTNAGVTWSAITNSATLNDSGCEATFIRYTAPPQYGKTRLLFANPNSAIPNNRANGTVRVSYDEGQTWSVSKTYFPNLYGYSSLAILPNDNWALLAENGTSYYYDQISFISDTLSNLTSGVDSLDPQTNPPPELHISIKNTELFIFWPTSSINYVLQVASGLGATNWSSAASSNSVSITNGQALVTLPFTNSFQLFRLNHP